MACHRFLTGGILQRHSVWELPEKRRDMRRMVRSDCLKDSQMKKGGIRMLRRAGKQEIEEYMESAYALALDQTRSGYPLFSDGIATKEQFAASAWESHTGDDRDLLLFLLDGRVEGWIQFFWIAEERYLQTNGFLIRRNTRQALAEFTEYARTHFPGYALYLGFPKRNEDAVRALDAAGWARIEESYHDIFSLANYAPRPEEQGIVRVTHKNFSAFRTLQRTDEFTYWDAQRIERTLDAWQIYLLAERETGTPLGAVYARDGEIFGIDYNAERFDAAVYRALMTAILNEFYRAGRTHVVFFHDEAAQPAALELGFRCAAQYILFCKQV